MITNLSFFNFFKSPDYKQVQKYLIFVSYHYVSAPKKYHKSKLNTYKCVSLFPGTWDAGAGRSSYEIVNQSSMLGFIVLT